jgi:hypothetical protein
MPLLRTTLSANPLGAGRRISHWDGRGATAPQSCLSQRVTSGADAGGLGARPPLLRLALRGRNGRCCARVLTHGRGGRSWAWHGGLVKGIGPSSPSFT